MQALCGWCRNSQQTDRKNIIGIDFATADIKSEPSYMDEVIALYDYEPRDEGDLKFSQGQILRITNKDVENADGWWMATNTSTGESGVIPSNFVAKMNERRDFRDELWWFDVNRKNAKRQLLLPGNPRGTFLVRESKDPYTYTLTVKNFDDLNGDIDVKHYHIKSNPTLTEFYINSSVTFSTLPELIEHYQNETDGLCCLLSSPCPKEPESIPFKNLEIQRSNLKLVKEIGKGKFGSVWKATYKNKLDVAVKTMLPGKMDTEKFMDEARSMHKLRHRRLLQLMGVVSVDEPIYIVTEFVERGSLFSYLQADKGKAVKFWDIIDFACQIAEGMEYLSEQKNCIHRDLRAANILVGKNNSIKVADFGLSRLLLGDAYDMNEDSKFPVRWTAPEAIMYKTFTTKSDVWSYGIVLYEMVTYGSVPYAGMTGGEMVKSVQNGYRLPNPENKNYPYIMCPEKMYEMMLKCWTFEPKSRPSFKELRIYFNSYTEPYSPVEIP